MFSDFRFGHLGYWASLLAIAVMGVALHVIGRQVEKSWLAQENTAGALQMLTEFGEAANEAESSHRGWIISRTAALEQDRDRALASAHWALLRLRRRVADDAAQSALVNELDALVGQSREVMRRGETLRRFGEPPRAVVAATAAAARQVMGGLKRKRDELRSSLLARVEAEREAQRVMSRKDDLVLLFAGGVMVLVLLPAYVGFIRETHARTRAETLLRDVTENLPAAVFRLRRLPQGQARFEYVSGNMAAVHEDDRAAVDEMLKRAAADRGPVQVSFRLAGAPERWVQATAQGRAQPDGSVLWHGYWEDITDKRRLEDALVDAKERAEAASRAKSRFLATMSHEIRTPMTGVVGMLEMLALSPLEAEQREMLAVVRDSGEALLRIIGDILDFSRMEAGKLELRPEAADLGRIVARVADLYAAVARNKGIELTRRIDPALHEGYLADVVRVQQVLSNLVSNALKFTDEGKVELAVTLELRGKDAHVVRFTVRDTGRGIDPDERKCLFKPFAQVAASADPSGAGLGLSISHGLAQLMGGSLSLESEPGAGTLATLVLPLQPVAAPAPRTATRKAPSMLPRMTPASADAPRILIVDDHPINRLVLDRQVTMLGYVAQTAASAREALERIAGGGFSAMLADVNMPELDGHGLAALVRERERREGSPRMVIIACTANAFRGDHEKCLDAGMDDYLTKPVTLSQLDALLRRWLPPPHEERCAQHA